MKKLNGCMTGIHLFIGIGAITGGMAAVLNPETSWRRFSFSEKQTLMEYSAV